MFKFPGNAQMNYIKRLVGLPGETIRVYQGDLFTATSEDPSDADFTIARKPAERAAGDAAARARHELRSGRAVQGRLAAALASRRGDGSGWKVEADGRTRP